MNEAHVKVVKGGAEATARWRRENPGPFRHYFPPNSLRPGGPLGQLPESVEQWVVRRPAADVRQRLRQPALRLLLTEPAARQVGEHGGPEPHDLVLAQRPEVVDSDRDQTPQEEHPQQ